MSHPHGIAKPTHTANITHATKHVCFESERQSARFEDKWLFWPHDGSQSSSDYAIFVGNRIAFGIGERQATRLDTHESCNLAPQLASVPELVRQYCDVAPYHLCQQVAAHEIHVNLIRQDLPGTVTTPPVSSGRWRRTRTSSTVLCHRRVWSFRNNRHMAEEEAKTKGQLRAEGCGHIRVKRCTCKTNMQFDMSNVAH